MNPMNAHVQTHATADQDASTAAYLSALCDGEISAQELQALLADEGMPPEAYGQWHSYQVIGAALRAEMPAVSSTDPARFLAGVRAGMHTDAVRPLAVSATPVQVTPTSLSAANESVFRWKLVAGFASLAAVTAVAWQLLVSVGDVSSPQLVQAPTSTPPAVVPVLAERQPSNETAPQTLSVGTDRGVIIRDAGLERLLAEHRQHGGMSALQNPTGFIRNATYDADAR